MNNSELVQIADILPPTAPVTPLVDSWIYILLLIVLIALVSFWHLRLSKQRFMLQLRRLRRQYQQHKMDNRRCAFQLVNLLRLNSQSPRVSASALSLQQNNNAWQEYSTALQIACYSRQGLDDDATIRLLDEAERWL